MTAKTEYVNLGSWSARWISLSVYSSAGWKYTVVCASCAFSSFDVCLQGGQCSLACCQERWDMAGWGRVLRWRQGLMSVCDISGVPLRFGFLPPLSQEGLLVVSHALKLSVRMLWVRGGHFFWTYHVLKVNTKHLQSIASRRYAIFLQFYLVKLIIFLLFLLMSINLSLVHPVIQPWLSQSSSHL